LERLGAAVHCLREWPKPDDARADIDQDSKYSEYRRNIHKRELESTPKDATHWSTRSMASEVGLSQTAVSRIWRAFGLQPHRQETWKLSKDP
jgi:hypothetical protein